MIRLFMMLPMASSSSRASTDDLVELKVISYNLHGFHQGCSVIEDLIAEDKPDIFLLQEHWLTPANLSNFDKRFNGYFSFGCSAMSNCLDTGMLRGRPYGGVMILVNKNLRKHTITVHCEERFDIIKVFKYLFINLYLPCSGTDNRNVITCDLLDDVWSWRERYSDCECVIAGDFNCNMDSNDAVALRLSQFLKNSSLTRCDVLFPEHKVDTYVNLSIKQSSHIDYILVSDSSEISDFSVLDPNINFSDHLPLRAKLSFHSSCHHASDFPLCSDSNSRPVSTQLRWDKADRASYYYYTGLHLDPLLGIVDDMMKARQAGTANVDDVHKCIESVYSTVVSILNSAARLYVPECHKGFFKFWWSEELSLLKEA